MGPAHSDLAPGPTRLCGSASRLGQIQLPWSKSCLSNMVSSNGWVAFVAAHDRLHWGRAKRARKGSGIYTRGQNVPAPALHRVHAKWGTGAHHKWKSCPDRRALKG